MGPLAELIATTQFILDAAASCQQARRHRVGCYEPQAKSRTAGQTQQVNSQTKSGDLVPRSVSERKHNDVESPWSWVQPIHHAYVER